MARIILNETSYFGCGCRGNLAKEVISRGFKKALVVTDKDIIRFGIADKIISVLTNAGLDFSIFSEVKANPTINNCNAGIEAFKSTGADYIIAIGGGSVIDTAKAVAIVVKNPDFSDIRKLEGVADTKK